MYRSMVWPHLEDCVQFWSQYLKKGITELKKVDKDNLAVGAVFL